MATQEQVLEALTGGPLTIPELCKHLKAPNKLVSNRLHYLKTQGKVRRSAGYGGPWTLAKSGTKTVARAVGHVANGNGNGAAHEDLTHPPAIGATKDPLIDELLERRSKLVVKLKAIDDAIRALAD